MFEVLLDRYEVLGQLGSGGLAEILRVRDRAVPGRIVALKRQHARSRSRELLAEFLALAEVQHPNLPAIYDYHDDLGDGRPGYTLEEVAGDTADRVIERLGAERVPEIAVGLLRALAHIHARGLAHGDLHPHNLIVEAVGEAPLNVKVLDLSPGVPRSGGMGALPYLAPERLQGAEPSIAGDLYSVGVTLHRLTTGSLPYPDYPQLPADGLPEGLEDLGPIREIVLRLLASRPQDRHGRAASVLAELAGALSTELPLLTPDIVQATLLRGPTCSTAGWPDNLDSHVHQELLTRGEPGVVLVTGAPGSGRSRGLRATKWALQARPDVLVLATSATPGDPPAASIRRLLTQVPAAERAALPNDLAEPVRLLLEGRAFQAGTSHDPERVRAIVIDGLSRALLALGLRRQTAILLDDLDAMDATSLDILVGAARYVAHRPGEVGSVAIVATAAAGKAADRLISSAGGAAHRITPPAFDLDATSALLRMTFLGKAPTHRLVEAVTLASAGNALMSGEAIATAFRNGWLAAGDDDVDLTPEAPSPLPVPGTATEALVRRLDELPEGAWALLTLVADFPVAVPAWLLAPALDVDRRTAGRWMEALRAHDILRWEIDEGEGRVAFVSPALRHAARERGAPDAEVLRRMAALDTAEVSLGSRVVCAVAARRCGADSGQRAAQVAQTLVERGDPRGALAVISGLEGPNVARVSGDAHTLLGEDDTALTAYDGLPPAEASRLKGILLVRRGRHVEALELLQAAVPEVEADQLADTLAWMAHAHLMRSQYDAAMGCAQRAGESANDTQHARLAYIVGLVHFYRGDFPAANKAFERALSAWQTLGRIAEQAEVVNAIGLVHFRQSELGRALDRWEETLRLADRSGDRERTWKTLMNLAVVAQERGEYGVAESRYREALSVAQALGHRSGVMKIAQNLGNLHRFLGELELAVEHLQRSLEVAVADGNRYIECHNRCLLGEVAWLDGRPTEAKVALERALAGFLEVGSVGEAADCQRSLAEVAAGAGDFQAAAAHAEAALKAAQETGLPRVEILAKLTQAEVLRSRSGGDLDEALRLVREAHEQLGAMKRPDLRWQVLLALHRVYRDRGEAEPARERGLEALDALETLAGTLPGDRRATFLEVRNRREAMHELSWLLHLGAPSGTQGGSNSKLTRLLDVNQRLNGELDLSRLLEYIIDSAILLTGAERGFLLMRQDDGDNLKVMVARNIDQENIRNKRHKVSYSIAQKVIETREAALTTDAMGDSRYSEYLSIHHLKLRSVLCLPMIRRGEVLGALYIDNRFQRNAFTDDDLAFMEAFADQAAIALSNARLLDERKRTLDALEKSQKRIEHLNEKLTEQLAVKERALEETTKMLVVQRRQLRTNHGYESIVGDSAPLRQLFGVLDRVCESEISVLVTGESGTGKELVAKAVHYNGPRKDRSFVAINCSSIPETLIESELFGHVRGSFTGATGDKKGVFEVAHNGTLFLDEIGEMAVEMQAKLLRALQEGEIQKVGSPRVVKVDVRIIAATNRNLRELVKAKGFREDLYYRLAIVTIPLPPLRSRPEDIPLLVQHFIDKNARDGLRRLSGVAPEAMRLLMRYQWPGNVRELETVIKNASIFCESDVLQPTDFSNFPALMGDTGGASPPPSTHTVRPLAELEREAIIHALEVGGGNKKRTAERLGIDRRTLYNKLAAYGISVERRAHVLDRDS